MPSKADPVTPPAYLKSPLAVVTACFALGIALARPVHASMPGAWLVTGCGVCLLAGLWALRAGWPRVSFLLALAGFAGAGAVAIQLFDFRFSPLHVSHFDARISPTKPVRLEGDVITTPFRTPYGFQFDVEVRRIEIAGSMRGADGRVRMRLEPRRDTESREAEALQLQYGDSIRATARLRRARVYLNPGSFDFRHWMESIEDLYFLGTISGPLRVDNPHRTDALRPGISLERARRRLFGAIDRIYPPWTLQGRYGAVLKAVLLGDRSSLNSDTVENFRKAGLYHLLVIAGLHLGLLAMLAGLLLRFLGWPESWRNAALLAFILAYAFLVEQRAPTLRATLMIAVYLLGRIFYRERSPLNAVGLAALVLVVYRPGWLFESGFQLSFSAALLIVGLVVPILESTTEPYRGALARLGDEELDLNLTPRQAQFRLEMRAAVRTVTKRIAFLAGHPAVGERIVTMPARVVVWGVNILLFSALLQLGLLLPMAETFHRVSLAGIGLNALAVPAMTLVLAIALPAVVLTALVPALAPAFAKPLTVVLRCVFLLTDLPNLPAWLSYRVPDPPHWLVWCFAGSVVAAAIALRRRAIAFWASLAAWGTFALLISLHPFGPRLPRGVLEVTALDCGEGDALFFVLPDQSTVLVDACGGGGRGQSTGESGYAERRWDPAEEIVSPYLWSRGIKKIDVLVLTASAGGLAKNTLTVLKNFRVEELWQGGNALSTGEDSLEQLRRQGVGVRELKSGEQLARGGAVIHVLWSPASHGVTSEMAILRSASPNESLALRISHDAGSVFLPGAIDARAGEKLARPAAQLTSQVLIVSQHGGKQLFTPGFIARTSPRVALLAAESGGRTGSPDAELLKRLEEGGARVFRTDLDGAVTVEVTGSALAVRTYKTSAGERTPGGADANSPGS